MFFEAMLTFAAMQQPQGSDEMLEFVRCTRTQVALLEPSGEPASDLATVIIARCNTELGMAAAASLKKSGYPPQAFASMIGAFREDVRVRLIGDIAERRAARLNAPAK